LLIKINERIEILLDRDHLIGHSYFMNIKDLNDLKEAFANKILPLLQEYFYGDYGKISLVLGEDFCKGEKVNKVKDIFAKTSNYETDVFSEKIIYTILDISNDSFDIKTAINKLLKRNYTTKSENE